MTQNLGRVLSRILSLQEASIQVGKELQASESNVAEFEGSEGDDYKHLITR